MSSNSVQSVMFVCEWNTCRSAMAEYIMRHLLNGAGFAEKIHVDSSGSITEGGEPIGLRTSATLSKNKIPVGEHVSKNFKAQYYKTFDLIIALDSRVLETLKATCNGDPDKKIRLLKDFDGNNISVEDPGYKGEHDKACAKIFLGCSALLKELTAK